MPKKKSGYSHIVVTERFGSEEASAILEELDAKPDDAAAGVALDFSGVTRLTADAIAALKSLGDQMQSRGRKLIVTGMHSEAYKALKIAGVSDSLGFTHRSAAPPG